MSTETESPALYVYGVTPTREAPDASGIAGAPVRSVPGEGVAALVSDLPQVEQVALGRDELNAHSGVLDRALEGGPVLPMRFGVVMENEAAVRDRLLLPHRDQLHQQLDRLTGKVEVRLRATYEEQTLMREVVAEDRGIISLRESIRGKPDDATYYERIRLGEMVAEAVARKREADAETLLAALNPLAIDTVAGEPPHERVALSASFLIEHDRLDEFDDAVDQIGQAQEGRMRLKYAGPLPPYSFVELSSEA
jgi:hypothetical protein